jgi:hypothetical protein
MGFSLQCRGTVICQKRQVYRICSKCMFLNIRGMKACALLKSPGYSVLCVKIMRDSMCCRLRSLSKSASSGFPGARALQKLAKTQSTHVFQEYHIARGRGGGGGPSPTTGDKD